MQQTNDTSDAGDNASCVTKVPEFIGPHPNPVKIVAASILQPSDRTAPIFVGDDGYGAILDAVGVFGRHFHVPVAVEKALGANDLEYLRIKGCFTLPTASRELIEAYFHYVHPSFPVIDGPAFLHDYATKGLEGINLLLLWSMFSISASYIPEYSHQTIKQEFINRGKLLFDLSEETDKIVLVQSALLLSFWFADAEDVKQSWYWTSIAFGIAQTLGLHSVTRGSLTEPQQSYWRTIWRCCIIRDVWLAFGMGRPLRIIEADGEYENVDCGFQEMVLHGEPTYSEDEVAGLGAMWQTLVTATNVLRGLLTAKNISPTKMKELQDRTTIYDANTSTRLLVHFNWHLQLHLSAVSIALARVTNKGGLRRASNDITNYIEFFLNGKMDSNPAPTTIPLIVLGMVVYLIDTKSKSADLRKSGNEKLEVFIQYLTKIEGNYPAASILKKVFATVREEMSDNETELAMGVVGEAFSAYPWNLNWPITTRLESMADPKVQHFLQGRTPFYC